MIVKAWKVGNKWMANVEDKDNGIIIPIENAEKRVGCAIRSALNKFQVYYGHPSFTEIEFNIDDW